MYTDIVQRYSTMVVFDVGYLMEAFYNKTSTMTVLDYDIDDLLNTAIELIAHKENIELGLVDVVGSLARYDIRDDRILAEAFQDLALGLWQMYKNHNVWDVNGNSALRYHNLVNNRDLFLKQ